MIEIFGIKNCDTVKKARQWLERHHIEYRFHDFRADGLAQKQVQAWLDELGLDTVINRRGTTWKQLDEKTRNTLDNTNAAALIAEIVNRLSLRGSAARPKSRAQAAS